MTPTREDALASTRPIRVRPNVMRFSDKRGENALPASNSGFVQTGPSGRRRLGSAHHIQVFSMDYRKRANWGGARSTIVVADLPCRGSSPLLSSSGRKAIGSGTPRQGETAGRQSANSGAGNGLAGLRRPREGGLRAGDDSVPYYHLYDIGDTALLSGPDEGMLPVPDRGNAHARYRSRLSPAVDCERLERAARRFDRPTFGLATTLVVGQRVAVREEIVWERRFCRLIHFVRAVEGRRDPRVLLLAPMSAHYATLLRGTVAALLPGHDVYLTDWVDARMVPATDGSFDLQDYVDYVLEIVAMLGGGLHLVAVGQAGVPALAAVALMEAAGASDVPRSLSLIAAPIDAGRGHNAVATLAAAKGLDWFIRNVIMKVPMGYPGAFRNVYPGFFQLTGFMSRDLERRPDAHREFFAELIQGDGDGVEEHYAFYEEFLAVMDLTAEFFLTTVEAVYIERALPRGGLRHRGRLVDLAAIRRCALLTIEGENDMIADGQTRAVHALCRRLPSERKAHYTQPGVGHFGTFNGWRWRAEIFPRVADFILTHNR